MTAIPETGTTRLARVISLERTNYADRGFKLVLTAFAVLIPVLLGFLVYELWTGASSGFRSRSASPSISPSSLPEWCANRSRS
jgi:hypothetical protein